MANYYFYLLNGGCWMGFLKKRVKIWRNEAQKGSTEKEAPLSRPSSSIDSSFVSGCT